MNVITTDKKNFDDDLFTHVESISSLHLDSKELASFSAEKEPELKVETNVKEARGDVALSAKSTENKQPRNKYLQVYREGDLCFDDDPLDDTDNCMYLNFQYIISRACLVRIVELFGIILCLVLSGFVKNVDRSTIWWLYTSTTIILLASVIFSGFHIFVFLRLKTLVRMEALGNLCCFSVCMVNILVTSALLYSGTQMIFIFIDCLPTKYSLLIRFDKAFEELIWFCYL